MACPFKPIHPLSGVYAGVMGKKKRERERAHPPTSLKLSCLSGVKSRKEKTGIVRIFSCKMFLLAFVRIIQLSKCVRRNDQVQERHREAKESWAKAGELVRR